MSSMPIPLSYHPMRAMDSIKKGDKGLDRRVMADCVKAYTVAAGHKVPCSVQGGRWLEMVGGAGSDSEWGAGKHAWQTTEEAVSG